MLKRRFFLLLMILCVASAISLQARQKFTLVIDAGHGGDDGGAAGAKTKEKNLTLRYALAFGAMVERNCPDVKVIYTRKTDRFVELWQRAEIANKNKADLFISVHINALPKGKTARGFQTYTLGRGRHTGTGFIENLEVAKRENSVILMEANYQQTYHGYDPRMPESDIMFEFIQDDNMENSVELAKYMQKYVCASTGRQDLGAHQDNLAVLRLTSMPGCLVELGFISTRDEEEFMNDKSSTDRYARGMFNAFQAYRRKHDKRGTTTRIEIKEPEKVETPQKPDTLEKQEKPEKQETPIVQETPETTVRKPDQPEPAQPEKTAPQAEEAELVFKVQFLTSDRHLPAGSKAFKGLDDVDAYKENGIWKYTVGASADYSAIYRLRKEVIGKFPQAFIIAFRGGERVNTTAAYQDYKNKKKQK
jgi:N-acetylmuramoyl-L-alanine amidase